MRRERGTCGVAEFGKERVVPDFEREVVKEGEGKGNGEDVCCACTPPV